MNTTRRRCSAEFNFQVALEAAKGQQTTNELASKSLRRLRVYHISTATAATTRITEDVMSITLFSSTLGLDKGVNHIPPTAHTKPGCVS